MPEPRTPDRYAQSDAMIHNTVAGTGKLVARIVRAVASVARHDWPFALGYVAIIAGVYLAGVRTIAHVSTPWNDHQAVSLLVPAIFVGIVAAILRHNATEQSSTRLRRQIDGVVAEGIHAAGDDDRAPRARIRTRRGEVQAVEVSPLPYRMSASAGREFETLWRARVPAPPNADDWRFAWEWTDNRVEITPRTITPLPSVVKLDPHDAPDGLAFRLGMELDANGKAQWVWWDPDAADPHSLVTGPTKAGKSVQMRVLLAQALAGGEDQWNVVIADPKGVDYRWADGLPGVDRHSGDLAYGALDVALASMHERQAWMEAHAPRTATNLGEVVDNPFPNLLVLIDETAELLDLGDKDRRAQTKDALGGLARRARFVNIVLVAATQRPDVSIIPGEIRGNLGTRVLVGEGEQGHKQMAFGSQPVEPLPANYPKGRGRVMVGGGAPREFQIAWIDPQAVLDVHDPEPEDDPADEPEREPADEPEREPADEPEREPADEPEREPADEPEREPADEPEREPADAPDPQDDETTAAIPDDWIPVQPTPRPRRPKHED